MNLDITEIIRLILARENLKQKELAQILSDKTGRKYTPGSLSQKLRRGTNTYDEVIAIVDILGYEIELKKKD